MQWMALTDMVVQDFGGKFKVLFTFFKVIQMKVRPHQDTVKSDSFNVHRLNLEQGFLSIIDRYIIQLLINCYCGNISQYSCIYLARKCEIHVFLHPCTFKGLVDLRIGFEIPEIREDFPQWYVLQLVTLRLCHERKMMSDFFRITKWFFIFSEIHEKLVVICFNFNVFLGRIECGFNMFLICLRCIYCIFSEVVKMD